MAALDQRSTRVTATGNVTTTRCRLHSLYFVGAASAGRITLTNGTSGGTNLVDIDVPASSGATPMHVYFGEESGVVFPAGIHCLTLGTTAITLVYTQ
jgi:hypothetical protein